MILYPVAVLNPDGSTRHRPAKVVASEGVTRVYVWDKNANDAALVMEIAGTPEQSAFRQHTVGTGEGRLTFADTGGCGCGHPLKRWQPPRPVIA